ncbi:MAG: hypothetical protein C0412_15570, partial [Flavobacterium sp.]|nr:hypothetical protein [Flavobacterium sp.]
MKIAFLTSYNSDFIKREFHSYCSSKKFSFDLWWNNYGAQEQNVYDKNSPLYSFQPDIVVIHFEVETLLGDIASDILSLSVSQRDDRIQELKQKISLLLGTLTNNLPNSKIVIENFLYRGQSLLGILDVNIQNGLNETLYKLNLFLTESKRKFGERIIINDFDSLVASIGKNNVYDLRMYHLGKYPFDYTFNTKLFEHFYSALLPLIQPRKKCIVVDLDNTLWGGIVGQDGIDNLQLGSAGIGESFVQFQKLLLNYYRSGVFLAVCSKNNYEDAIEVIEKHPGMILRKGFFSSIRINWLDKATNISSIAKELNIGIDSIVFIDDNPAECELVKQQMPEVDVINLTGEPDNYIKQLLAVVSLQSVSLTEEDLFRNLMHSADEKRKEAVQSFSNLDDYYKSLEMKAFIGENNTSQISRVAQLTQKTNQFNLTTRRYTNEEIKLLMSSEQHKVYTLRLVDKFGDNGIVLVAIVKTSNSQWTIDTLLMSCRVIGRQAETVLLNFILDKAKKAGAAVVSGQFVPTK